MRTYEINVEVITAESAIVKIGFGEPASNDQIVKDAKIAVDEVKDQIMGKLVKLTGPASLPVAFVIAHELNHICPAVAVFDPKLGSYVVSVTHSPLYQLGDLL